MEVSQAADLASLPSELLIKVIEGFSKKDFKSLRLVNHKLNILASQILFESITVTDDEASMLQLQNITALRKWSSQVKVSKQITVRREKLSKSYQQKS